MEPTTGVPVDGFAGFFDLLRRFRAGRFDVAVSTTPPPKVAFFGALAAKSCGVPHVTDVRDPYSVQRARLDGLSPRSLRGARYWWPHFLFEAFSYHLSSKVFVVTGRLAGVLRRWFRLPGGRFATVRNGTDADVLRPDPVARRELRRRLGVAEDGVAFAYVGVVRGRGVLEFVRHLGGVVKERGWHVLLVLLSSSADGPLLASLDREIRQRGLSGQVHRLEPAPLGVLARYLSAADFGVSAVDPADDVTLPVKNFDYLACGLPVVGVYPATSPLSGFVRRWRVGLVAPSWSRLASRLPKFVEEVTRSPSERETWRRRCAEIAEKHLSRKVQAERAIEVLKNLTSTT
ncbi:MAG: hypothetical protein Kow0069_14970 [Promethearchaeota archaeon]